MSKVFKKFPEIVFEPEFGHAVVIPAIRSLIVPQNSIALYQQTHRNFGSRHSVFYLNAPTYRATNMVCRGYRPGLSAKKGFNKPFTSSPTCRRLAPDFALFPIG